MVASYLLYLAHFRLIDFTPPILVELCDAKICLVLSNVVIFILHGLSLVFLVNT